MIEASNPSISEPKKKQIVNAARTAKEVLETFLHKSEIARGNSRDRSSENPFLNQ